jgi:hypothetical protein
MTTLGFGLEDALKLGASSRKFTGSSDCDVHEFTQSYRQKAALFNANPRQTTCSAADLTQIMLTAIPINTPAYDTVKQIRSACSPWLEIAEGLKYKHFTPTQQVLEAALGSNSGSLAHREIVLRELQQLFGSIIEAAEQQQLVVSRAPALPSARVAGRTTSLLHPSTTLIIEGEKVTPHLYAFHYVLAIVDLRFGQATLQQENEFKQLKQGYDGLDTYAMRIKRAASKLKHRAEFNESYCVALFVQGVSDKECSRHLQQYLSSCAYGTVGLDAVVELATRWERNQQQQLQVSTEIQVAARMQQVAKGGKAPGTIFPQQQQDGGGSSSNLTVSQLKRQLGQLIKTKYGPEHADAPCTLPGHRGHSNAECREKQRALAAPAAAQYAPTQYRQPAAAVQYYGSQQDVRFAPEDRYGYRAGGADFLPAAAMQPAGAGKQVKWADQQRAAAARHPMAQQQPQQQLPRPPGLAQPAMSAACNICGFQDGHRNGVCFYDRPERATTDWRPSLRASQQLLDHYRRQCARSGTQAKEPRQPAAEQQRGAPRPAGALAEWEQQWEPFPAQYAQQQHFQGEPQGWFAEGDVQEPETWFPAANLTDEVLPAAVATRSRQPHSFLPADNTQPRLRPAAADIAVSPSTVPLQLNLTVNLEPQQLPGLFSYLYGQNSTPEAAATLATTEPPSPPAAALQQQPVLERCVLGQLAPMFPDAAADPEEVQMLLAQHAENMQVQHLHLFSSSESSSGVTMAWGPIGFQRHAQPPRAASDSGCVPSIISEALVQSTGLRVRPLSQKELSQVRSIDGTSSSRFCGRTEPLTIILCKGTEQEVSLTSERGFLVVKGPEAAHMYSMVIGRDLLDQVSGFVVPVTNKFCYMPRLQQGDPQIHTMPVVGGRAAASSSNPMQAAALADALAYMPACASFFIGDNPPAETEQGAAADTQSSPRAADAATQTDSKPGSRRKQRLYRQAVAAEIETEVPSDCGPTVGAWGVASTAPAVLLWLLLWPLMWLLGHARDKLGLAWRSLFGVAMQPAPRQGTTFWRLGRGHRSAAGETIYLQPDAKASGRKPRSVIILRPVLTLRYVMEAWSSKTLLFLLMLAAVCLTSTHAMDSYLAVTADSASLSLGPRLVPPLPYNTAHLLAAGLTDNLGSTGKCFRC